MITPRTPVYYINLDDSLERNRNVLEFVKKVGLENVMRITAVDTRTKAKAQLYQDKVDPKAWQTLEEDIILGKRRYYGALTLGAIGCTLSHLKVYEDIVRKGIEYAVVFEDDILVGSAKDEFWKHMYSLKVPRDADFYLLCAKYYDWVKPVLENTVVPARFVGTYAYLITNKGAQTLLENLVPIKLQVDFQISTLHPKLKIYGYNGTNNVFAHGTHVFGTTIQDIVCTNGNCGIFTSPDNQDLIWIYASLSMALLVFVTLVWVVWTRTSN